MKRWTGRMLLGSLLVRPESSDLLCHIRRVEHVGADQVLRECAASGEVWVCPDHADVLYHAGILVPQMVDAEEGDPVEGRCTGENERGERCGRDGAGIYPAMPRCRGHEDQLPTRWDLEAEDEAPIVRTRWDEEVAALARRAARAAAHEAAATADRARRWRRLQRHGRVVLAEARTRLAEQQGALALD